jgi:crotonobetainyl-CoA:carnitine CoA-transferase CaiB-like acyl-CoA transferase
VQSPAEVADDPQALANDYFLRLPADGTGPAKTTGFPWDFSATPAQYQRPAPECGQHTEEVLTELGYTAEQIAELKDQGVLG